MTSSLAPLRGAGGSLEKSSTEIEYYPTFDNRHYIYYYNGEARNYMNYRGLIGGSLKEDMLKQAREAEECKWANQLRKWINSIFSRN